MNASGTKLQLVVSASIALLEIVPEGWSRSHSESPWRMLSVPSVAMIDGRRKTRTSSALKTPTAKPDADQGERAAGSAPRSRSSASSCTRRRRRRASSARRPRRRTRRRAARRSGPSRRARAASSRAAGCAGCSSSGRRPAGPPCTRRPRGSASSSGRAERPPEPDPGDRSCHARAEVMDRPLGDRRACADDRLDDPALAEILAAGSRRRSSRGT